MVKNIHFQSTSIFQHHLCFPGVLPLCVQNYKGLDGSLSLQEKWPWRTLFCFSLENNQNTYFFGKGIRLGCDFIFFNDYHFYCCLINQIFAICLQLLIWGLFLMRFKAVPLNSDCSLWESLHAWKPERHAHALISFILLLFYTSSLIL